LLKALQSLFSAWQEAGTVLVQSVSDLAEAVKAVAGSGIADVAGQHLKRPDCFQPLRRFLYSSPRAKKADAFLVCNSPLSAPQFFSEGYWARHAAEPAEFFSPSRRIFLPIIGHFDKLLFFKSILSYCLEF